METAKLGESLQQHFDAQWKMDPFSKWALVWGPDCWDVFFLRGEELHFPGYSDEMPILWRRPKWLVLFLLLLRGLLAVLLLISCISAQLCLSSDQTPKVVNRNMPNSLNTAFQLNLNLLNNYMEKASDKWQRTKYFPSHVTPPPFTSKVLDQLQFAERQNHSVEDTAMTIQHTIYSLLEGPGAYVRIYLQAAHILWTSSHYIILWILDFL